MKADGRGIGFISVEECSASFSAIDSIIIGQI